MELSPFHSCKRLKTKEKCYTLVAPFRVAQVVSFKMVLAIIIVTLLMYRFMNSKRIHPDLELNLPRKVPGRYIKDANHG